MKRTALVFLVILYEVHCLFSQDISFHQHLNIYSVDSNIVYITDTCLFESISLYPNTSTSGSFQLAIKLDDNKRIDIHIVDIYGILLFAKSLTGSGHYFLPIQMVLNNGEYFLSVTDGHSFRISPFIVPIEKLTID